MRNLITGLITDRNCVFDRSRQLVKAVSEDAKHHAREYLDSFEKTRKTRATMAVSDSYERRSAQHACRDSLFGEQLARYPLLPVMSDSQH